MRPLCEMLAEIADPRNPKGLRHPFGARRSLCVVAMLAGAKTPKAIANWWKNHADLGPFWERRGFTQGYGPSKSTLYRGLSRVGVEPLEVKVSQWIEEKWGALPPLQDAALAGIALDGKTLRGSRHQAASPTHG